MTKQNIVYFIQDNKTELYWDGSYHRYNKPWAERIRFFRTLPALVSSVGIFRPRMHEDQAWNAEYDANHGPLPSERRDGYNNFSNEYWTWHHTKREAWDKHYNKTKKSSLEILKEFCKNKDYSLWSMIEGQATETAKAI